jgi:peptide/nickel transport system substrate-binding protein
MRKRLFGLLATTAIVVAACQGAASPSPSEAPSSAPSEAPASTEPSPEPTPVDYDALLYGYEYAPETGTTGGSVIVSDWQAANQLNPYYSNAFANSQVFAATMRALAVVSADGHWKPDLSETLPKASSDITMDESGTGFTVKLTIRPGLKWSDGETLDLNDLAYTWKWVLDPDQPGISTLGWDVIDTFEVADDGLSADVHFTEPYAGWLGLLIGSAVMPEHYLSTIPVAEANATSYPVSPDIAKAPVSGPFKYVTASADTIELERNDNWAGPAEACDGTPCLDRVTYKFFPDNKEGMIAAFLAGEIDVAVDLVQADYDAIKVVDPAIGRAILEPAWLYEHLDMNQAGLGRGQGHPALQDTEVRLAIAQAIDKDAMFQTVFPGSPLPEEPACSNATPTNYWLNPDLECLPFDVAAANARLDAAGYADSDGDGIRNMPGGGDNLDFVHCTSTAGFRQTGGEFLAASLQKVGIQLELNFVDSTAVYFANWPDVAPDTKCNLAHGQYDTAEFAYVLSFDLFGNYYYSYHSEQIPTDENNGDGYNYLRYSNADMDAALNTLKEAILTEDQLKAAYTIQEIYVEQAPEVALYYRNEARGVAANLKNFLKNPSTSSDMWNIEDWFVTQ